MLNRESYIRIAFAVFGCIATLLFFHFIMIPRIKESISETVPYPIVKPVEVPEPWIVIQRGPRYSKKITCPLCDTEADIFTIRKSFDKSWTFGYFCSKKHFTYYDEKMNLQSSGN